MKSTTRIAAATRIAAMNGARRLASEAVTGLLLAPQAERDRRGLLDRGHRRLAPPVDEVEDEAREQPEDDDERAQRDEGQRLDRAHVGEVVPESPQELGPLPEHDPLGH